MWACRGENQRGGWSPEFHAQYRVKRRHLGRYDAPRSAHSVSSIRPRLADFTSSGRFDGAVAALAARLTAVGLTLHLAQLQASAGIYKLLVVRSTFLSYIDVYWLLVVASAIMFLGFFFVEGNEPGKGENVPDQCELEQKWMEFTDDLCSPNQRSGAFDSANPLVAVRRDRRTHHLCQN